MNFNMQYLTKESENHKKLVILTVVADQDGTMSILFKNIRTAKLSATVSKSISIFKETHENRLRKLEQYKAMKIMNVNLSFMNINN